jgi:hypothetical protein
MHWKYTNPVRYRHAAYLSWHFNHNITDFPLLIVVAILSALLTTSRASEAREQQANCEAEASQRTTPDAVIHEGD